MLDATDERTKLKEAVVHDALAFRIGQKLASKADETARRDLKLDPSLSVAGRVHRDHLGLSASEFFDHGAAKLVRHVAHQQLKRLAAHALDLFDDDFRTPETKLKALSAHIFGQNRDLQLAAAANLKFTFADVFVAHRDIGFHLAS